MSTVYLVDDHPVIRESYALLIDLEDDLSLVGTAATGTQALAEIPMLRPDVVVVDIQLPDMTGVELVATLTARLPGLPIVVSSGHVGGAVERDTYAAGARAYVPKHEAVDRLADTLREVLRGGEASPQVYPHS